MTVLTTEYISVGGNRNASAADWDPQSGCLAFGADQNVAFWKPANILRGVSCLLRGHNAHVTALKFLPAVSRNICHLVTGSADGELRGWRLDVKSGEWECFATSNAHQGSLNAIAVSAESEIVASAGADATVKIWRSGHREFTLLQAVPLKPRYIPLAIALGTFEQPSVHDSIFLVVGGTRTPIQIYVLTGLNSSAKCQLQATLTGHDGWVQSLSLYLPEAGAGKDILLASASQDRYVRIWQFHAGFFSVTENSKGQTSKQGLDGATLTSKTQLLQTSHANLTVVFEALLVGHEDWIYTAAWNPASDSPQLLTASADSTLTIWEADKASGMWVSSTRLGDISGQKGATTATGSAGGFWIGLWSPDGREVACLGRTGSWRRWKYDIEQFFWTQNIGVSGHVGAVTGLAWGNDRDGGGTYLLSCGADQTTRLHAEWKHDSTSTWHEISRPQIHGYDLNCITSINEQRFVSGADEKLLRVFGQPSIVANMLHRLCQIESSDVSAMPKAANIPVLGLSNKEIESSHAPNADSTVVEHGNYMESSPTDKLDLMENVAEPPSEDVLARQTLWPEIEKLYGHGYDISEVASNASGTLIASACKATSVEQAVIRLYDGTKGWQEIRPPLAAHSLTITRLRFGEFSSPTGQRRHFLLSVGRDRQWTVFELSQDHDALQRWTVLQCGARAHSRMILDAAWSPLSQQCFFATAGRDKVVKIWGFQKDRFSNNTTVSCQNPVTAIDFTASPDRSRAILVVGEDNGKLSLHVFAVPSLKLLESIDLQKDQCPTKTILRVACRPHRTTKANQRADGSFELAVASADSSLRVFRVSGLSQPRLAAPFELR